MTIALFSDIHANLPALEATLADIDRQKPDAVYCLGGLVGDNIWPNEVIEEVRRRAIPTVGGNYDYAIGNSGHSSGFTWTTEEERRMDRSSVSFTNKIMMEENRAYLRSLPIHIRLEYKVSNSMLNMLLVHASPYRTNEGIAEDRGDQSILRIMREADADIMCFGHTHLPYYRVLHDKLEGRYRHAVNIGSVGMPKDGNPFACWVLLTLNGDASMEKKDAVTVKFMRVPYDVGRAAQGIENSPLSDVYADMLRRAY